MHYQHEVKDLEQTKCHINKHNMIINKLIVVVVVVAAAAVVVVVVVVVVVRVLVGVDVDAVPPYN